MKNKILCLAMTVLMVIGIPLTVNAEDYQGADDWSVSFDGDRLNSNFTSAQMTEDILNIQPGDSITIKVNLKNDAAKTSDWYMTNEVLQTLEDSNSVAEGGAYTYILTFYDQNGVATVLYSSEAVGGEDTASQGNEGLHQTTSTLEDYFYLVRLRENENASVTLYVGLDGETQGNDYQDTLARLRMNFAVEKVNDEVITRNVEVTTDTTSITSRLLNLDIVKTDDASPVTIYSVIALISGLALLVVALISMKKRSDEKGEQQ